MNKFVSTIICVAIALSALFYVFKNHQKAQSSILRREIVLAKKQSSQKKFEKLVLQARPLALPVSSDKADSRSSACQNFEMRLLSMSLESLDASSSLPDPINDCSRGDENIKSVQDQYLKACLSGTLSKDGALETCVAAASLYRAIIDDRMIRDQDLESLDDQRMLVDVIVSSGSVTQDWKRMMKAARRLHDLEPELYQASKAQVAAALVGLANAQTENERAEIFSLMQKALGEAEEYQAGDTELAEAAIMLESRMMQDIDRAEGKLEELHQDGMDLGLYHYYRAGIEWKHGNKDESIQHLQKALALEPKSERFQDTLSKLRDAEIGTTGAFSFTMGVSFEGPEKAKP